MDSRLKLAGMTGRGRRARRKGQVSPCHARRFPDNKRRGQALSGIHSEPDPQPLSVMPDGCYRASRVFSLPTHTPLDSSRMDSRLKLAGMTGRGTCGQDGRGGGQDRKEAAAGRKAWLSAGAGMADASLLKTQWVKTGFAGSLRHDIQFAQHFFQVTVHLDLLENIIDFALLINDERRAFDAHELPTVERFFFPHAIFL